MTSKLAKQQIEQWWKEGLKPTVEDIVLVNNLGLQVERGSDMFNFSVCPRIAFLGDNILREPTVQKRVWIDDIQRLFADTVETKVYVLAYALSTPDEELPPTSDKKKISDGIVKFRDEVLVKFTDRQILAAIDYVMNGMKPDLDLPEDADDEKKKEVKEMHEIYDVPTEDHSLAKQLLLQALSMKMSPEVAKYALLEDLDRMVLVAAMNELNGANIMKNEHTKASGRFYIASGRIHKRLVEEKNKLEEGVK